MKTATQTIVIDLVDDENKGYDHVLSPSPSPSSCLSYPSFSSSTLSHQSQEESEKLTCPQNLVKSMENKKPGIKSSEEKEDLLSQKNYCEFCSRTFPRFEHLKRHSRIHTGEKPYVCEFPGCTKSFSRSDNMKQHYYCHFEKGYRRRRQLEKSNSLPVTPVDCTTPLPSPRALDSKQVRSDEKKATTTTSNLKTISNHASKSENENHMGFSREKSKRKAKLIEEEEEEWQQNNQEQKNKQVEKETESPKSSKVQKQVNKAKGEDKDAISLSDVRIQDVATKPIFKEQEKIVPLSNIMISSSFFFSSSSSSRTSPTFFFERFPTDSYFISLFRGPG